MNDISNVKVHLKTRNGKINITNINLPSEGSVKYVHVNNITRVFLFTFTESGIISTLFILDTIEQVLWQTVKTQIQHHIR